jgi:hypothetical protein
MMEHTKPRQVVIAGRLMWALWALGGVLLLIALGIAVTQSRPGTLSLAIMCALAMSLLGLLIRSVLKGRNWARILYALLACLALGIVVLGQFLKPQFTLAGLAVPVASVIAYAVILRLLFHPLARPWFRRSGGSST